MNCSACQSVNDDRAAACGSCGAALAAPAIGPGFLLASRYEIGATLGKGGMGVVFRAHDRLLAETVAIKVLRPDVDDSPELGQRFIAELKLARAVSHRHVCRIHEYGEDRGLRYISMAYVDGVDLKRMLRQRGTLPVDEAFRICIAIAEGLDAIHEEGIVHRDLKPQNVMIDGKGHPRLMDFGIAKVAEATSGFTETGRIVGTPEYMSPEQVRGHKLDRRSDVYALGILVHEVFTGTAPFHADTPVALLMKHLQEPPQLDLGRLPGSVVPVLTRALEKDRDARYATVREMRLALEDARAKAAATAVTARGAVTLQETNDLNAVPGPTGTSYERPRHPTMTTALPVPGVRVARTVEVSGPPADAPSQGSRWILPVAAAALVAVAVAFVLLRPEPATVTTASPTLAPATLPAATPPPTVAPEPEPEPTAPPAVVDGRRPAVIPPPAATRPPEPVRQTPAPTPPPRAAPDPRLADLLRRAEVELLARRYAAAVALYDQALAIDPASAEAREMRTSAVKAQVATQAAPDAPAPAAGRLLVAGQTVAHAPDAGKDKAFAEGFDAPADMEVTRDSTVAALPGRLILSVSPERVRGGDEYTLKVMLQNTGTAPIEIAGMSVTSERDGRKVSSAVPTLARIVAPRQTAVLLSLNKEIWPDVVRSWAWSVQVRTTRGETYTNQLVAQ